MSAVATIVLAAGDAKDKDRDCSGIKVIKCGYENVSEGVGNAINGAKGTIDFWQDPWGNTFKTMQAAAKGMSDTIMPALTKATLPDLTVGWFLKAYAVSFALAIMLAVVLLFIQIWRTARGKQSGRDLAESIGMYWPGFLVGSIFGPAIGIFIVTFFTALTDAITGWGITSSTNDVVKQMSSMLDAKDASGIIGGSVMGVLLMAFMIVALFMVLLVLIVQLITLYFSGVLFPLGLVWLTDGERREAGWKIAYLWIGLLASHALLFLLLGTAFTMVSGAISAFGEGKDALQSTVTLITALLAIFMAALSPFALLKFAPIPMSGSGNESTGTGAPIGKDSLPQADQAQADKGSPSTTSSPDGSGNGPGVSYGGGGGVSAGGGSTGGGLASDEDEETSLADVTRGGGSPDDDREPVMAGSRSSSAGEAGAAEEGAGLAAEGAGMAAAEGAGAAGGPVGLGIVAAGAAAKAGYDRLQDAQSAMQDVATQPVDDHAEFGDDQ